MTVFIIIHFQRSQLMSQKMKSVCEKLRLLSPLFKHIIISAVYRVLIPVLVAVLLSIAGAIG